jgi:hypothetical protein
MQAFVSPRHGARWPWLLIAVLLLLGISRFLAFSTHAPVLGYPNNFDFLRTSGCVGIWNFDAQSEAFHSPAPDRVVAQLHYNDERLWQFCNPTAETLYLSALKLWHSVGDTFPIQHLAYAKLAILLLAYAALMWALRSMRLRVFLSACFVLLWWDMSTLLYFQSLYPVFSSLFFSLFVVIALLACRLNAFARSPWASLLLAVLTFMLGFSNQQYFYLAIALTTLFLVFNGKSYRLHSTAMLCAMVVASLCHSHLRPAQSQEFYAGIDRVNRTDTIFYGVLMHSSNPEEAAVSLGLRPECAQMAGIGAHAFNHGLKENICPEVASISRLKLLNLAAKQPATIARTMLAGLEAYKPVYGFFPQLYPHHANELAPGMYASSPSSLIVSAPRGLYLGMIATMALLAATAFVYAMLPQGRQSLWAHAIWLGGMLCFYSIFSSVFGDGMVEVERHAAVFLPGFILLWLGTIFGVLDRLRAAR